MSHSTNGCAATSAATTTSCPHDQCPCTTRATPYDEEATSSSQGEPCRRNSRRASGSVRTCVVGGGALWVVAVMAGTLDVICSSDKDDYQMLLRSVSPVPAA